MVRTDHKRRIGRAFGAADRYERMAHVQRIVADRLAGLIAAEVAPPSSVLEIGSGTGFLTRALMPRLPAASWVITDLAPEMVARCRAAVGQGRYLAMDGEHPCFDGPRFDLICSSLAFQWFDDLPAAIARLCALLRPGGALAFATMAEGSFAEWRAAHGELTPGTPAYPSPDTLAALAPAGARVAIEAEAIPQRFADAREFLAHLREIGAHVPARARAPLSPGAMRGVMRRFEAAGATATYRVAYCRITMP
jgi:malonyl-CoA O-methyltransferase